MIKAEELRVGNALNYVTSEGNTVISIMDWKDIKWISEDPKGFNLVHSPIFITNEILIEVGFEDISSSIERIFKRGNFNWFSSSNEIIIEFDNGLNGYDFYSGCKHFHKLQNLFFEIKGEELKIK